MVKATDMSLWPICPSCTEIITIASGKKLLTIHQVFERLAAGFAHQNHCSVAQHIAQLFHYSNDALVTSSYLIFGPPFSIAARVTCTSHHVGRCNGVPAVSLTNIHQPIPPTLEPISRFFDLTSFHFIEDPEIIPGQQKYASFSSSPWPHS
jgi:hypothetical protein